MNGQTDLIKRVNDFLAQLNLAPLVPATQKNDIFFTTLLAKEQQIFVYLLPQADLFYLESPVMKLPAKNLLDFYQYLMELNNWDTVESYFAIVERENQCEVVLQLMRPAEEIDRQEFQVALNVMINVYARYKPELTAKFGQ